MEPRSPQFQKELGRIEELINALNSAADSAVAAQARELVQALLELHGTTLERALEIVHENDLTLVDKLAEDPLVSNLLILHGLHPLDLEARVRGALEKVKLRLEGNCNGCPSSRVTLKSSIEEAIYAAAPDVTGMEVEGAVDNFVTAPNGLQPKFTVCPTDNEQETTIKGVP